MRVSDTVPLIVMNGDYKAKEIRKLVLDIWLNKMPMFNRYYTNRLVYGCRSYMLP